MNIYCLNDVKNIKEQKEFRKWKLSNSFETFIGRKDDNQICLFDPRRIISGKHAKIFYKKGKCLIEDLNSTNGTYIKKRDDEGNDYWHELSNNAEELKDKSVFRLGNTYMIASEKLFDKNEFIDFASNEGVSSGKYVDKTDDTTIIHLPPIGPDPNEIKIKLLYQLKKINSISDYQELLKTSLSIAQDLTGAYSGGIILREDANKRKFTVALGLTNKEFNYKLINQIFDNLGKEGIKLNNIYCHPLNSSYKCIGCIYLQDAKHLSENVISVVNIFSDEMAIAIENARQFDSCTDNYPELREELHNNSIICESENHLKLFKRAGKWANKDVPIIYIEGETGTGKEYLAKFIHKKSKRNRKPYKAINCSTIPETLIEPTLFGAKKDSYTGCTEDKIGIFEAANNGVIFLDEFGSMSSSMQAKLLRVFEEKSFLPVGSTKEVQVDIMIICANNESLESLVKKGEFREDLYFRLRQTLLTIPLRNRSQEIPGFINLYLHKLSKQFNSQPPILSKCAIHDLTNNYYYPGNVRNIIEVIEYLVLEYEGKTIDKKIIQSLPMREKLIPKNFSSSSYQVNITLEEVVQQHILNVLINVEIKISKAAKLLDITRDTVHRKMGKLIADTLKKANGDKEKAASLLNIDLKIFENIAKKVKAEVAKNI